VLFVAAWLHAGPLAPPAGPITSTGRTLEEVYNRIPATGAADGRTPISSSVGINTPGSYVLTANISATGSTAIAINADNVTLDLNGFTISGTAGVGSSGVSITLGRSNAVVRNGNIVGFQSGVSVASNATGVLLEDLVIRNSKLHGVIAAGNTSKLIRIRRCSIMDVGATTTSADSGLTLVGIQLAGGNNLVEDTLVSRFQYFGTGTPTIRGIHFNNAVIASSGGNVIQRCTIANDVFGAGNGIQLSNSGTVYRDNNVLLFGTPYSGGTDGGGNQ